MSLTNYKIKPGKLHSGGSASCEIVSRDSTHGVMSVKLCYVIHKRALVPVPKEYLSGEVTWELPLEFSSESGYLELCRKKVEEMKSAEIVYVEKGDFYSFQNVHRVKILAKNKLSEIEIFYHPTVLNLGWIFVKVRLHISLPMLENYEIEAEIIKD